MNLCHIRCTAVALAALSLVACSHQQPLTDATSATCSNASRLVASTTDAVAAHRYAQASLAAERAARIALQCASTDRSEIARFGDRWRGANALVLAAEFAHQAAQNGRARTLLAQGYTIMDDLQPPHHLAPLTSTLISQQLDGARRDLHGQWAYW